MRKLRAWLWGMAAATVGALRGGPSLPVPAEHPLSVAQLVASEEPGISAWLGAAAMWKGLRARSWRAFWLGAIGLAAGLWRWLRREDASLRFAEAMREGLGMGWQSRIPPEVHRRFVQQHRTELVAPLLGVARARVRATRDVLFAAPDGDPLRLDVYEPAGKADAPRPAVVVLHGGLWTSGDKGRYGLGLQNRWLAACGYVVFDVQYRLGSVWPAPLADVKCALRWVRANAERYGVDTARIALLGQAGAGGHLALLAAYTAGDGSLPVSCYQDEAGVGVRAVVAVGAPADLRLWPAEPGGAVARLLGGLPQEALDAYAQASPVTHVRAGLPPTLLVHGTWDRVVPPEHSALLTNALRAAGVPVVFLRVPEGRHGLNGLPLGLFNPMIQYDIDRFLAWAFYADAEPAR